PSTITRREIFEGTKGRFEEVARLQPALEFLARHGYIRERQAVDHPGPGRKPSTVYEVNPQVYEQDMHGSPSAPYAGLANPAGTGKSWPGRDQGRGARAGAGGKAAPPADSADRGNCTNPAAPPEAAAGAHNTEGDIEEGVL